MITNFPISFFAWSHLEFFTLDYHECYVSQKTYVNIMGHQVIENFMLSTSCTTTITWQTIIHKQKRKSLLTLDKKRNVNIITEVTDIFNTDFIKQLVT